jgi:hypothetical protein
LRSPKLSKNEDVAPKEEEEEGMIHNSLILIDSILILF